MAEEGSFDNGCHDVVLDLGFLLFGDDARVDAYVFSGSLTVVLFDVSWSINASQVPEFDQLWRRGAVERGSSRGRRGIAALEVRIWRHCLRCEVLSRCNLMSVKRVGAGGLNWKELEGHEASCTYLSERRGAARWTLAGR